MYPATCCNVFQGIADRYVVTQHRTALGQINQRELVSLGHLLAQLQAIGKNGTRFEATVIGDNGDVIARMHADEKWFGH